MESLPREIVLDILSRLPTKTILHVKLVCRSWRTMAQDPVFVDLHLARATESDTCLILHCDYPERNQLYAAYFYAHNEELGMVKKIRVPMVNDFHVLGSSNGLLCFRESLDYNALHAYNPWTSEFTELTKSPQDSDQRTVFGFGFLPTKKEYKLVQVIYVWPHRYSPYGLGGPKSEVHVLTLGTPAWRSLGQVPYHLIGSTAPVLVHGRLHWINWPLSYRPGRMLVSFDLANEQFQEVPQSDSPYLRNRGYELLVLGGCLAAAYYGDSEQFDIWIMKDYGVEESWVKEFSIGTHVPRGLEEDVDSSFKASKFYQNRYCIRPLWGLEKQ